MIVGIDLGTTHSLVSAKYNDEVVVMPNALGEKLTPSVVSIGEDGHVYVGKTARERFSSLSSYTNFLAIKDQTDVSPLSCQAGACIPSITERCLLFPTSSTHTAFGVPYGPLSCSKTGAI